MQKSPDAWLYPPPSYEKPEPEESPEFDFIYYVD